MSEDIQLQNIVQKECFFIYMFKNKINNKIYIGQTNNLRNRFLKHKSVANLNKENHPLYNSIRKYGINNFDFIEIEAVNSLKEANEKEIYWIKYYNSNNRNFGYNITEGGLNCKMTEETKKKLSIANKGEKNAFYGKKHSDITKNMLRQIKTGKKASDYTKIKMSEKRKGKNNGMYGKKHTEESKRKISETRKAKGYKMEGHLNPFYGKKHDQNTLLKIKNTKTINKLIKYIKDIINLLNTL